MIKFTFKECECSAPLWIFHVFPPDALRDGVFLAAQHSSPGQVFIFIFVRFHAQQSFSEFLSKLPGLSQSPFLGEGGRVSAVLAVLGVSLSPLFVGEAFSPSPTPGHGRNPQIWAECASPRAGQLQIPNSCCFRAPSSPHSSLWGHKNFFYKCGNRAGAALQDFNSLDNWKFSNLTHPGVLKQTLLLVGFFFHSFFFFPLFFPLLLIACYSTIQEAIKCFRSYNKMDTRSIIFPLFAYFPWMLLKRAPQSHEGKKRHFLSFWRREKKKKSYLIPLSAL